MSKEEVKVFAPPSRRGTSKFLGLEGITIVIPLLAFGLGAAMSAFKSQLVGPGTWDLFIFMIVPPLLATVYVLVLVNGKPKNYDRDLFVYWIQCALEKCGVEGEPFFSRPAKSLRKRNDEI